MVNTPVAANQPQDSVKNGPGRKRFHNPSLPLVVLDPDGSITHLSKPARNLLEFAPNKRVDHSFFSLIHGKQLYQVMRDIADMVCHGKSQATWLIRLRTDKGRWKWFKADVYNMLDKPGGVVNIILTAV